MSTEIPKASEFPLHDLGHIRNIAYILFLNANDSSHFVSEAARRNLAAELNEGLESLIVPPQSLGSSPPSTSPLMRLLHYTQGQVNTILGGDRTPDGAQLALKSLAYDNIYCPLIPVEERANFRLDDTIPSYVVSVIDTNALNSLSRADKLDNLKCFKDGVVIPDAIVYEVLGYVPGDGTKPDPSTMWPDAVKFDNWLEQNGSIITIVDTDVYTKFKAEKAQRESQNEGTDQKWRVKGLGETAAVEVIAKHAQSPGELGIFICEEKDVLTKGIAAEYLPPEYLFLDTSGKKRLVPKIMEKVCLTSPIDLEAALRVLDIGSVPELIEDTVLSGRNLSGVRYGPAGTALLYVLNQERITPSKPFDITEGILGQSDPRNPAALRRAVEIHKDLARNLGGSETRIEELFKPLDDILEAGGSDPAAMRRAIAQYRSGHAPLPQEDSSRPSPGAIPDARGKDEQHPPP